MKKFSVFLSLLFLFTVSGKTQLNSSPKSNFMIRHTVVFKLKYPKGSSEESEFFRAATILTSIPGVHNFESLRQTGKKNDYDYGFSMEFDTMKAYEDYNQHPDHIEFVKTYWEKYVEKFLEIDYEPIE